MKLTIVISKGEEFFIGTINEIPSVILQGSSIEEAKENVLDALELYLEDMQSEEDNSTKVLEEDLNDWVMSVKKKTFLSSIWKI